MQYIDTQPDNRPRIGLLFPRTGYLLLIPLLLLAAYELSAGVLLLLALASVLGFSFVERLNRLCNAGYRIDSRTRSAMGGFSSFDGGSFPTTKPPLQPRVSGKTVYDGGSFERARLPR